MPVIESLPEFKIAENKKHVDEFNRYRCRDSQIRNYERESYDHCKKFYCAFSISAFKAASCNCNPTGSFSSECDRLGGSCKCKPNVMGRKCDQCISSTWGFGPNGCQACNCNTAASKDDFCDVQTGSCSCYDNIEGKKCDSCKKGYWYFSQCISCECKGNADSCDQQTGVCINCKDNTEGSYCEKYEE